MILPMSNKYNNTVIYKIVCLDSTITDVYIGSTTDFNSRKRQHKYNCCNENSQEYIFKIYETIRANGGIDNWNIIIIESYPCETDEQKRERERYWYDVLQPSMNMYRPLQTEEEKKEYRSEYDKNCRKEWREKNKEKYADYSKNYYEENKEFLLNKQNEYYEENKEKIKKYANDYYENNKEKKLKYANDYRKKNREKINQNRRERRALKSQSVSPLVSSTGVI